MNGEEIAWRTLNQERVEEPCIMASWVMKREFFRKLAGVDEIYEDAAHVAARAYANAGANLCPQFIMGSPRVEHSAADPFHVRPLTQQEKDEMAKGERHDPSNDGANRHTPESIRDEIEKLPDPDTLEKGFDVDAAAKDYADSLRRMRDLVPGEILFIREFGQADFMGGYCNWGYNNYMLALAMYPEHMRRYFDHSGEHARLFNVAIGEAVRKYGLAPFVYGGQDICFKDGPICSVKMLDELYFPALERAVGPLHDAGVKIIWHCDGDVRPLADRLINRIGVAGFQGFQEETGCTLESFVPLRSRAGRKLILWGSLSVTTTLPFGTVDDVKRDVERCFRAAAPGGGYVLASTSSILPDAPLENIMAMFDHGKQFGREFLSGC